MLSRKVRLLRAVLRNPQHVLVRRERNPCLAGVSGGLQIPERGGGREEKRSIVRGLKFRPEEREREREPRGERKRERERERETERESFSE